MREDKKKSGKFPITRPIPSSFRINIDIIDDEYYFELNKNVLVILFKNFNESWKIIDNFLSDYVTYIYAI